MRLTQYTDYSLRVLMFLGLRDPQPAQIGEIAERYGISHHHLAKVVPLLAECGYITTQRGRTGGLRLAQSAARIRVGDVVRRCEADLALVECFNRQRNTCVVAPACVLTKVLEAALAAFLAELDRHTLADILVPQSRLVKLLAIR